MSLDGLSKKSRTKTTKKTYIGNINQTKKTNIFLNNKNLFWLCLVAIFIGFIILLLNNPKYLLLPKLFYKSKNLVIFQNNAEIRPTGGFIGSFGIVDTNCFKIKDYFIDSNIYKRDNAFTSNSNIYAKEKALYDFIPEGKLAMRDSNWDPDFSISAKQISWFYEKEDGFKVDNVIAINSNFFKKILDIIGPIKLVKYDITVTSENFNELLQEEIEQNYYKESENQAIDEPKTILKEMAPIVISRIKNIKYWNKLYSLIYSSLKNKDVMLFSYNKKLEEEILNKNYGGQIINKKTDYLLINNANLGGTKSSIYMEENVKYNVSESEGKLLSSLKIIKSHTEKKYGKYNKDFTRIFIPKNIKLLDVKKNDISILNEVELVEENNKNVIKFFNITEPGETIKLEISYFLPDDINKENYQLIVQKQSGSNIKNLEIELFGEKKYDEFLNNDLSF